ncbi:MAG: hypothetical protein WCW87_03595 [Candidatus Paceibacterota bacterium]
MQKKAVENKKGMGLLEVVIGSAIILLTITSFTSFYNAFFMSASLNNQKIEANALITEGFETVRFWRDSSWNTKIVPLTIGSNYYLSFDGSNWVPTTTKIFVDNIFERTIVFNNVYRDANKDISSSGTLDTNIRKVTVSVSWNPGNGTTTRSVSSYITNLLSN